jgi:archaellum component FlaF (FlaF/FlaG flagellin family)
MLRNALYENYLPPSINNLKINAKIVFLALLIITIVWYVYSKNIYMQLKDNIENIHSSKNRMNSLTDIGANTRILASMNQGRVNKTRGGRDYEAFKRTSLLSAAQLIQQSYQET